MAKWQVKTFSKLHYFAQKFIAHICQTNPNNALNNGIYTGMHTVEHRCIFDALSRLSEVCSHTLVWKKPSEASDVLHHRGCVGISGLRGDNYNLHSAGCCGDAKTSRRRDSKPNTRRNNRRVYVEPWERQKCMKKLFHVNTDHYRLCKTQNKTTIWMWKNVFASVYLSELPEVRWGVWG